MAKSRRLQVPVTVSDEETIRAAARLYKVSAAEWVRRVALKAAQRDLAAASAHGRTPEEALAALVGMNLPVDDLADMTEAGIKGRLVP